MEPRIVDRRAWVVVAMLFGFMLINFADKAVLGLSAGPIIEELHLTHTQFGQIASSFFLFFSIAAILVGFVVNRVSSKLVLLIMALTWSVAQVPMLFLAGLPFLIANRVLLGAGEGPAYPVALHAAYKWFPNARRPLPTSLIAIGAPVGAGIAAPLIAYLIVTYSWHAAFGALGVVGLIWSAAWLLIGREGTLDAKAFHAGDAAETSLLPAHVPYARLLGSRTVLGVMALSFAAYWLLTLAVVWLPNYLNKGAGYSPSAASWIVTTPALLQIFAVPAICALSETMKRRGLSSRVARGMLTAGCVFLSGALTFALPMAAGGIGTIFCVIVAFSIGSTVFSLGHVIVAEVTPPGQRGAMLGINNAVATLAGVCAPFVMGWVVDMGTTTVDGFRMGFMVAGGVVAVCSLIGAIMMNPEADIRRFSGESDRGLASSAERSGVLL